MSKRAVVTCSGEYLAQALGLDERGLTLQGVEFDLSRNIYSFLVTGDDLGDVPEGQYSTSFWYSQES